MATISERHLQAQAAPAWRMPRYVAEVFDGADEALVALETVQADCRSTAFQTLNWLTILFEELAPAKKMSPRLVVVSDHDTGDVALVLPLLISKSGWVRTAMFADLGVSDYNAPMLGPAVPTTRRAVRRLWRAIRRALRDVDLLRLERMPKLIAGGDNPLLSAVPVTPARHAGHLVTIDGSVEAFLASRGKKYRKEVERCTRLWHKEGQPRFQRAEDGEAIARAHSALEDQQGARHEKTGTAYVLNDSAYRSFYERLAINGSDADFCYLFSLEAEGEIVATLLGVVHDATFTLLRISNGGARWSHLSPGRLVVVEAMRYFVERGVRNFDMGIGDYAFKRGFGASEIALFDVIVARGLSTVPRAAAIRTVGRMRRNPAMRALYQVTKRLSGA